MSCYQEILFFCQDIDKFRGFRMNLDRRRKCYSRAFLTEMETSKMYKIFFY